MPLAHFKLVFFSPIKNTSPILAHLFGKFPSQLGKIGDYEQCAFISRGTGERGLSQNANPVTERRERNLRSIQAQRGG
jgi:hypothetical protein